MSKRKLLLITNGFPFGDSERGFLSTEFQHLQEAFEIYVLARITEPPPEQWEGIDRSRVSCTGMSTMRPVHVLGQARHSCVRDELVRACKKCDCKLLIKRISAVLRYSARAEIFQDTIERLCREEEIDLIYTFWCTQATLAAVRVKKKKPHIRVVVRFHGYDLYNERTAENWQPFRHEISKTSDRLVFACQKGENYFLSHWQDVGDKTMVSYLGSRKMKTIDFQKAQGLIIVSCSNLIGLKRVEYMIDALAALPDDVQIQWHHYGDGSERVRLEQRAREKLSSKAAITWKFWGAVENAKIEECYHRIQPDVFLTTSSTEGGVPVTIQEAFAMGIPVIGTAVGGIPELVIDGSTGYLLPENPQINQVSEAIMNFAALSPEERQKMSGNAWKMWQEKCDAKENACRFTQMLKYLLS